MHRYVPTLWAPIVAAAELDTGPVTMDGLALVSGEISVQLHDIELAPPLNSFNVSSSNNTGFNLLQTLTNVLKEQTSVLRTVETSSDHMFAAVMQAMS